MIRLMNLIQTIFYTYELNSHPFFAVHQSMKSLYASYQKKNTSCNSCMDSLKNLREFITHCVGSLG